MLNWLILGSVIMSRLLARPVVPPALLPTYAIEVAPPAVATFGYLALYGPHINSFVAYLGGFGILMVAIQLRLAPAFLRLKFAPSTWAFTFSWTAVAIASLEWLQIKQPAGYVAWQSVVLAAITGLIGAIAARTLMPLPGAISCLPLLSRWHSRRRHPRRPVNSLRRPSADLRMDMGRSTASQCALRVPGPDRRCTATV